MMTINGGGRSRANLTPSWIARQGGRSVGDDDNCNNADATAFVGGAETMTMTLTMRWRRRRAKRRRDGVTPNFRGIKR
jgi:hypothetical protein